ncbi:MAG TPA: HXXEE domain-containing protein [Acidobacteriota bacterium]|nr:HXXEE domain-containing protein [Acidobacteriota bacterium]
MNFDGIATFLNRLTLRQAVWLFPIAYALHILEEAPQFPSWAQRYASQAFTPRDFLTINSVGIALAVLYALLISRYPRKWSVILFFSLGLAPGMFFNILFHVGATAAYGVYCPGLITALVIYPPVFVFLSRLAYQEHFLTGRTSLMAFAFAGAFHTLEVGIDVFKIRPW